MYAKGKGPQSHVPSDIHAKEKLALYVYDYLMHVGASKAAQTFLSEIRWEKQVHIGLTDPPGFLLSWWCVFWDLYCAAPERRDAPLNDPSNEAKAFHDYGFVNSGSYTLPNGMPNVIALWATQIFVIFLYFFFLLKKSFGLNKNLSNSPLAQMTPQEGMTPNNPMQQQQQQQQQHYYSNNLQHPASQTNNPMMMQNQPFARYPGPRGPMRMPTTPDFTGQNVQLNIESTRTMSGMSPLNRLTPPGSRLQSGPPPQAQMGNYNSQQQQQQQAGGPQQVPPQSQTPNMQMRGQPSIQSPLGPPQMSNPVANTMSPHMGLQGHGQNRWPGPPGPPMNYSSPSPVSYGAAPHCPNTPIMQSPQDANSDINYGMMKGASGGMTFHDPNLSHMVSIGNPDMMQHHQQHLNGDMMETLKSSPNSRNTVDEHQNAGSISDIGNYSHFGDGGGSIQNESDAILKLKETMQEETKRFEKHHDIYSD